MTVSFFKQYRILIIEVFGLIALGAAVRAMNAGLACPDWPLCFGDYIPDYHPQVYFEFIHRVLAGLVALATCYLHFKIVTNKENNKSVKILSWVAVAVLFLQIIMGGLTVLLQLKAYVVTMHLGLATIFLCLLHWVYFSLLGESLNPYRNKKVFLLSVVMFILVFLQILLGGTVASNYAANVCSTFPLCHGQLIPTLSGAIGLQVMHRLGAYTVFILSLLTYFYISKVSSDALLKKQSQNLFLLILLQVGVGISNVLLSAPALITVLHSFVTSLILVQALKIIFIQRPAVG